MAAPARVDPAAQLAARDTPWYTPVAPLAPGEEAPTMSYNPIPIINNLPPYSLRNGTPDEIEPYLLSTAIPEMWYWVPINGIAPKDAIRCVDGFIRCYLYKLRSTDVLANNNPLQRKLAIILGTCRAVMTANYELTSADINPRELAAPLLSATIPAEGSPTYRVLVPNSTAGVEFLRTDLTLTPNEMNIVKVLSRSAQAIIPVQGLNLITEGHHYLSDKSKQSFKAFTAVEKQVWVMPAFKDWLAGNEVEIRDAIWHKAGHPVAVPLKEAAATSPKIKENLEVAKMGSAAARLPALESDLRAADTYLKLAESVNSMWGTMGGSVDSEMLRFRVAVVKDLPRTAEVLNPAVDMGGGVMVESRAAAINVLKATVAKNSDKAALLYGFYCSMLEMGAGDMSGASADTLRAAYSLKKLRSNNVAAYMNGVETYKDFRAMKNAARKSGTRQMPAYRYDD